MGEFAATGTLLAAGMLLTVVLPFTASFVLDGIVAAVADRGLLLLLAAALATALTAAAAHQLWTSTIETAVDAGELVSFFAPYFDAFASLSVPLALVAFLGRMVLLASRPEAGAAVLGDAPVAPGAQGRGSATLTP